VDVAVLGPLEVRDDERIIRIGAAKQRAVLALLALRAGAHVSAAELVDALWWECAPASATKAIQMYISSLRRVLGAGAIETSAGGYLLALTPDAVDVGRFESLCHSGRELAPAHPGRATAAWRQALGLWRGSPFPELAANPPGAAMATRLEEMRCDCEEDLAEVRLRQGEHRALVAELEAAVALHPLRERRWGQLIVALYRSGRQADALRAYQRLRTELIDELGIEPSQALRELEQAVLDQDPALDLSRAPGSGSDETGAIGEAGPRLAGDPARPAVAPEALAVLCTDMVGPTGSAPALDTGSAPALDGDGLDGVRRRHLATLPGVIAEHQGRPVKTVGDGVLAVFASPSCALACAVAIQQRVEHDNRGARCKVAVRIGLSAGEVTREDVDVSGDPVDEAARLCERAAGGTILVAELLRLMAGRRGAFDFSSVGALELKGLDRPVPAATVQWVPLPPDEPAVPLVHPLASAGRAFVDRVEESAQLQAVLERANGSPRMALVAGEPGIGKTALAAVVSRRAADAGWTVLYGRCDENLRMPYQPFVEALSHYVTHAPSNVLSEHVSQFGGDAARLVPTLARRVAGCPAPSATEPEAERYLTFGAVTGLLAGAARAAPLVLVLDDLHWADRATLLLLRYLAEHLELASVFALGTYRSSEVGGDHPLHDVLPTLHRSLDVVHIDLGGLANDDVVALAEASAGQALDQRDRELASAIHRETAGNPFFVLEILRHLSDAAPDATAPGDETGEASGSSGILGAGPGLEGSTLPRSVRAVVAQRVARLGPEASSVLAVAAVLGGVFALDTVQAVLDVDAEAGADAVPLTGDLLAVVERAVAAELVVERSAIGQEFAFAHALVQKTLYSALSAARRTRLHGRVAAVLEARADMDTETQTRALAHHWSRAGDVDKAMQYARRAGELALDGLAPDEAVRWSASALALQETHRPDDRLARCDLLTLAGSAQRLAGDADYRTTLLEAGRLARDIGDGTRMATAALACYRGFWSSAGRVDEEKVEALEAAIAAMGEADSSTRARLLATLANELTFCSPLALRRSLVDEATGIAQRLGDAATTLPVLTSLSDAIWVPGAAEERLAASDLAVGLARQLEDPVAMFYASNFRLQASTALGHLHDAEVALARMRELSEEIGQPILRWMATFARASRALLAGDHAEAERLNDLALELGTTSGQPDSLVFYGATLSYVRWQQGRMAEMVPFLWEAARENPGIPSYWGGVAWALADSGDTGEAARLVAEGAALGFAHLPDDLLQLPGLAMYAEAAIRLGATEASAILYDLLAPWHGQLPYMGVGIDGPVDHYLGALAAVLGRIDVAEVHLGRALDTATQLGAHFFEARTRLEWARALAGRQSAEDDERAAVLAGDAVSMAQAYGYPLVAQRARTLATRLGR
jgi:DNA-binding SARP family transcriptional activator/class 3 adenylate cyclase/tetratricopeptide (TPR) repeat protein